MSDYCNITVTDGPRTYRVAFYRSGRAMICARKTARGESILSLERPTAGAVVAVARTIVLSKAIAAFAGTAGLPSRAVAILRRLDDSEGHGVRLPESPYRDELAGLGLIVRRAAGPGAKRWFLTAAGHEAAIGAGASDAD